MNKLGIATTVGNSLFQTITDTTKYGNKVDLKMGDLETLLENIAELLASAIDFNLLAQEFNNLQWSNFSPTVEDFIGGKGENALNIGASTLSATMLGIKSAGPWGAFAGLPVLAGNLGGYFAGKKKAESNIQKIKDRNEQINQNLVDKFSYRASAINQNNMNNALLNIAAEGGYIPTRDFTNGMTFFSEGGSHEENPYQGVLQGIAPDGKPNLVEEGEWKYKDYIYSKRLKVPKKDYEMLGLKEDKEYTYADAAAAILKESEERPNDPVSIRNLDAMMGRLQNSLETFKQKRDVMKIQREFEKLSPEELAYMVQAMSQPQQEVPVQAQYAANGGHLFDVGGAPFDYTKDALFSNGYRFLNPNYHSPLLDLKIERPAFPDIVKDVPLETTTSNTTNNTTNNSHAQTLRAIPIIGSGIGALASLFDKPNYSNIEKAERALQQVPRISAGHIGQKLTYNPIDVNYLATIANNQAIGARRAATESSLGNAATAAAVLPALNYTSQTALGSNLILAAKENADLLRKVLDFNRGTDSQNIASNLEAAKYNQNMDYNKAQLLLQTGQLRDAELAKVQANRSASLSNFFNNMGKLGEDKLNRSMVQALIDSGAYFTISDAMNPIQPNKSYGGKIKKKGGKHA